MPKQLTPQEQKDLFQKRGMKFPKNQNQKDSDKIQEIGYYKLKLFATPFSFHDKNGDLQYRDIRFKDLLNRYYQDKNLRIYVLHAIEDIEVNLANNISTLLGKRYGAFGYLNFSLWCNRDLSKFKVEEEQFYFKQDLFKKVSKSHQPDLKLKENQDRDGFPTVWLMVNVETLGSLVHLLSLMSPKNQKIISQQYNCSPQQLISWLSCLNLARNTCAHNADLIDMRLKTKPKVPTEYKEYLCKTSGEHGDSLAIILFIVKTLMNEVNSNYDFGKICTTVRKLVTDDEIAHQFGFKDKDAYKALYKNV